MPILGSGIIPSGVVGAQLTALTRRAFIPKLIVQNIYQASPLLSAMVANSQMASGGVSSVTVPVQGAPFVTSQWSDYTGTFNQPVDQVGAQNAEFNLKLAITPIPFLGMEGIVQINAAVIPIIAARMNDAGNNIKQLLSTALWNNDNTASPIEMVGLPGAIEASQTYGGIDRSQAANSFWRANVIAHSPSVDPTRDTTLAGIVSTVNFVGGEMPTFIVMAPGTWLKLSQDFTSQEQYQVNREGAYGDNPNGARAMFQAIMVAGVPVYMDPNGNEGEAWYINTNYQSFYIHEDAAFAFTGFESTLPNFQLGYVGALLAVMEMVNTKPSSCTHETGLNFVTL